jgi:hypothetical protein
VRYEAYKKARTIGEFLQLGGSRADLKIDMDKHYVKVGEAAQGGVIMEN